MEKNKRSGLIFKLVITWMAIVVLGSFWMSVNSTRAPLSLSVMPQAPRNGDPIVATFKLNNPSLQEISTTYHFYANGQLLDEGVTAIAPGSEKTYQYAYPNLLKLGDQLNFSAQAKSQLGSYDKVVSTPPYPPQVWSSFISFATFSTSIMSSMMTSMMYYQSTFASQVGINVGIVLTVALIGLLIFLELSQPAIEGGAALTLGRLRIRISTVTWILLIIFIGIVYTKGVMILAG